MGDSGVACVGFIVLNLIVSCGIVGRRRKWGRIKIGWYLWLSEGKPRNIDKEFVGLTRRRCVSSGVESCRTAVKF